ncbi:hypothetical protein BJX99DRAFT_250653 [Aspergillus californicus]
MTSLQRILGFNASISSTFPPGLVALFVGATSGIGEATLKAFAKHTRKSRVYFVGRSEESGARILAECRALNPEGEYIFMSADVSLIKVVDEVCDNITAREPHLNILCLSQGVARFDRSQTSENVHLLAALTYYSRVRFMTRLLSLIKNAPGHRRVLTVAGGGLEGPLDPADFPALRVPVEQLRGHLSSLITLGLEAVGKMAPEVSFIHDYPGTVNTPLSRRMLGENGVVPGTWITPEESGERHVNLLTSKRYPPAQDKGFESTGALGVDVVRGSDGEVGSGVYSLGYDGECVSDETYGILAGLREIGMVEQIWKHTEDEFARITGQ